MRSCSCDDASELYDAVHINLQKSRNAVAEHRSNGIGRLRFGVAHMGHVLLSPDHSSGFEGVLPLLRARYLWRLGRNDRGLRLRLKGSFWAHAPSFTAAAWRFAWRAW